MNSENELAEIVSLFEKWDISMLGDFGFDGTNFQECHSGNVDRKIDKLKELLQQEQSGPPKRAWRISLNVGADTFEDAVSLAEELLNGIHPASKVAHGGVSAGGSLDVSNDPEMTHEKYVAELDAYLEKEKQI